MARFFQSPPELMHPWSDDAVMQAWLRSRVPEHCRQRWEAGLESLGHRAREEMPPLAESAERCPPVHISFDPWGRRVDEIRVSDAWTRLEGIAAEEGIVATAYERLDGAWSRVHQFLRLYLYHPSSAIASCPMAMTDGAARVIERHGDEALRERVLPHLLSRDPVSFWTAGQWMTERSGGSDVSRSETVAVARGEDYRLYGDKWFTSATTSRVAMTLARVQEGAVADERLSLFFVELRDEDGALRNIRINRLKDKLGTRALPTAELTLEGVPARLIGERGRGVPAISSILNITRLYNACCAAGYMGRGLMLALDYARKREAFGRPLIDQPLHRETLADLTMEHAAAFELVFECARLLGRQECDEADETEAACLRLLTPVAKLYTGKQAVAVCSEVLECFGGAGYVEDTGLPVLLRDAQVLSIWEGTTNVLSLDLLRALSKEKAWDLLLESLKVRIAALNDESACALGAALEALAGLPSQLQAQGEECLQANARHLAFRLAAVVCGILLLETGEGLTGEAATRRRILAHRWIRLKVRLTVEPSPAGEAASILGLD
ncbi:acyl-CoA dehydrogenase family protein [Natronospira bacteriovora]|uniref:Acyl-CoA dehydrogenase family protein n=1 Tax=Natronospira bacteriovora TaxID=3069753 RepID=A0ABU0W4B3_9GAMM|nr:acyl-CoA dehydrogenase family protein [Natronospira sp. AB-CW4]MDQ2068811.1 acyl-CoA dehydrogenase family protein [Natronospira sp. AB-CW4]